MGELLMAELLNVLFTGDFSSYRHFESVVLENKGNILGDAISLIESADLFFLPISNIYWPNIIKRSISVTTQTT